MKYILVATLTAFLCGPSLAVGSTSSEKNRQRLDELFLWKLSESLNLRPQEEGDLRKAMKEIKDQRAKRVLEVEETLKSLQTVKEAAARRELMQEYRRRLTRLNESQVEELDQLEKILGADRMPDYVLARERLLERIKGALGDSSRDNGLKSKVQNPKVIEQK